MSTSQEVLDYQGEHSDTQMEEETKAQTAQESFQKTSPNQEADGGEERGKAEEDSKAVDE